MADKPIDLRDSEPNTILSTKVIMVVAQRGYGDDWSAYWMEMDPIHTLTPEEVVNRGNKLTEEAAKYNIFKQIGGGPYRA